MLKYSDLCKAGICTIKRIPFHVCKELTVIYIVTGRLKFTTVSGAQILHEGQIEILNVEEPIMLESESESCRVIYFSFDHAFLKSKNTDFECVTYNCNICNFFSAIAPKKNIDVLTNMMLQTVRAIYANEPYAELKTRVEDLLDYIMKYFDDVGHLFSGDLEENIRKERFQRISSYMISNVTKKIPLNDIAKNEYLSVPYLSKEYALRLGKNYNVVSNYYKTIDAVIQLLDTDNTLTYIAETSGFSSIRYYNKAFTNYLGCLPSKFRSLYKGKTWDAADEKITMQEFDQMSGSPIKQATQTIIKVELQTENQGLCRYTFTGYAEKPQTYTLIIDGAKNLKKGIIMHIDDELNRYLGDMTAHDFSDEVNVFKKMQGIRHEVRYLEASESEVKTTLCGKWYVELYIVVV